MHSTPPACRLAPWDPRRAEIRLAVSLLVAVLTAFLAPGTLHWHTRGLLGWDAGALTLLLLAWSLIIPSTAQDTRANAAVEDPGRTMVWVLALTSSFFSFFAALFELSTARALFGPKYLSLFAVLGVVLSWFVTHTSCALRYAHLYYSGDEIGGLEFPGDERPCDLDFAYFAFTIGMCFQTSDVTISSSRIRRIVLGHSLVSFIYNTMIFAMTLNFALDFLR